MTKVSIDPLVVAAVIACASASAFASADRGSDDGAIIEQPLLAARVFYPAAGTKPVPGILVLGGAEGGRAWAESISRLFVSQGYVAMAETYFGAPGLAAQLQLVPLERFRAAIDRLESDPRIDPHGIAIVGLSKGAEAALIGASRDPRIRAVVAASPSDVAWEGIDRKTQTVASSWSAAGQPLAFVSFVACADCKTLASLYETSRDAPGANRMATIPVEKFGAPILMRASERDAVWPSLAMADAITRRLAAENFGYPVETIRYPEGGHFTLGPPAPEDADADAGFGGGTPAGVVDARRRSWPLVLSFLKRSLQPE